MKKFAISLGLTGIVILGGTAISGENHDIMVQKVRIADEADTDGDGRVSRDEYLADPGHRFEELDKDGDGFLSREERKYSGFSMSSELEWDSDAHDRLMREIEEEMAEVEERLAEAMEELKDMDFGWHGDFDFDGLDFHFSDHDDHFFSHDWLGRELMDGLDDNEDGEVSRSEFLGQRERLFDRLDENEDGILDEDELADFSLDGTFAFERFYSEDED